MTTRSARMQNDRLGTAWSGGRCISSEQHLAIAVLRQALADATGNATADRRPIECRQARLFLESSEPDWCDARRTWCDNAGIDPAAFEDQVAGLLARADEEGVRTIIYRDGIERAVSARYRP